MWCRDGNLLGLLEGWWNEAKVGGSISFNLAMKLQIIKKNLKEWNKEKFQNIFTKKENVESELEALNEKVIEDGMQNEEFHKEKQLKVKLIELLMREEMYW